MSVVAAEVKKDIYKRWTDKIVGRWVIDQLPLLHREPHNATPIYDLFLTSGLRQINRANFRFPDFRFTPKFVVSGGCEGTGGQLKTVQEMWDIRALMSSWDKSAIAILLEPDSFIRNKGRRPLVDLTHRKVLWAESGLVDAVVTLPTRRRKTPPDAHYRKIHGWISPARWVSNPENPAAIEIATRHLPSGWFEWGLLTKHRPQLHTSFLASTQHMTVKETRKNLFGYLLSMVQRPNLYTVAAKGRGMVMSHAGSLFRVMSEGLQ